MLMMCGWALLLTLFVVIELIRGPSRGALRAVRLFLWVGLFTYRGPGVVEHGRRLDSCGGHVLWRVYWQSPEICTLTRIS